MGIGFELSVCIFCPPPSVLNIGGGGFAGPEKFAGLELLDCKKQDRGASRCGAGLDKIPLDGWGGEVEPEGGGMWCGGEVEGEFVGNVGAQSGN